MTVKKFIENTDYSLYRIANYDGRGCNYMNKDEFIKRYNASDLYSNNIKTHDVWYYQCNLICDIILQ